MPLTPAEKSKKYREKLKTTNPEKYKDIKNKNKARAAKSYHNKKNSLSDAQKEEHRLKLLQKKNRLQQTVHTIQSTSNERSDNTPHQDNSETEDRSSENEQDTQNSLAVQILDKPDQNETESGTNVYRNRSEIKRIQKNMQKKTRTEVNKLREQVQKLMRGYNSLQREMRKLKSDYRDLAEKYQEQEAETDNGDIGQNQEYTPNKRTENFVSEILTNVATPEKQAIKKKILEYNVLTDSIKSKYKTSRNQDKNTFKDIVDNEMVKRYKLKTCLTKSLGLKNSLKRHIETKTKTHGLIEKIRRFYERDDVSRASAGKKECRTYKKCKMQIRYLLDKLENLHKKYVSEVGSISFSTFKKYRPFYVISPDLKDLETCGCLKHCNMQFIVNALKSAGILESNDVNTILANIVCDPDFRQCMYGECSICKDNDIQVNIEENVEIKWFSWNIRDHEYDEKGEKKKTKRMAKNENIGKLNDLVKLFNLEIKKFKIHVFNMRHQYIQYKLCVDTLDINECAIHVDFSENWLCKHHEEVQAMHFGASKKQITLHMGVLYIKNEKPLSFCSISPDNSHNPEAIWAHLDPILKFVRLSYPNIDTVHFFSDGPTSQYRQKKNFFLMTRDTYEHGFINFTWSYFEASHGKGAADGVGGTIKRTLDFKVSHGTDIPDAQTAFNILQETATSIKIFFISSESIKLLDTSIVSKLIPIRNTLKIHQIVSIDKYILTYRILSCFCENLKGKCECFGPEIHSFKIDTEATRDGNRKDENGMRLELDETTGILKPMKEKENQSSEIKENEVFSEEELFDWNQSNFDIDETNIDVNVFNDSELLNEIEFKVNDTNASEKHVEKDNEVAIYNPDSLNMFCLKVLNIHSSLSNQNTTAKLSDVCPLNKISKNDSQNLPFKVMNDNDLPKCLQPEILPFKLSGDESKVSVGCSKLIILSNVKVDVSSDVQKNDIKAILKGAEVITESALKTNIVTKKKDIKVKQNNALRETDKLNKDASTSNEADSKRKRKNVTDNTDKSKSSTHTVKKKKISYIETSSENSDIMSLADTDDSEYEYSECLDDQEENKNLEPPLGRSDIVNFTRNDEFIKKDDWIVAKFATKKSMKHFVGRILWVKDNMPTVKFVRKVRNSKGSKVFTYPNVEDVCEMQLDDVIKVLPQPNISRRGQIIFQTDSISHYNLQ